MADILHQNDSQKPFGVICAQVLPYVQANEPLPEPWASDPDHQAARALWSVILFPGRNQNARLVALKEYYERTRGKPGEGEGGLAELDLNLLMPDERVELVRLLRKAQGEMP